MAENTFQHNRLAWSGGDAKWPREPSIAVIKSIAIRQLAKELPYPLDDDILDVDFFKEGGFNKLYKITYPGHPTAYLLRVAIPIEPYYKIESEVATIAYLCANTSIPLPRILAWNSNRDNELTFEWILMEKIEGVPLWDVWRVVPWEQKLKLTENIAGMVKQLRDQRFERIGGLYFEPAIAHAPPDSDIITGLKTLVKNGSVDDRSNDCVDDPANEHVYEDGDKPGNEPLDEHKDKLLSEAADEPVNKPDSEPSEIFMNNVIHELVEALVNEVADEFVSNPEDRDIDYSSGKASGTAMSSTIGDPGLVELQKENTQPLTGTSECVIEMSEEKTEQVFLGDNPNDEGTSKEEPEPFDMSMTERSANNHVQPGFTVGRMFDPVFFMGNRPYLPANCGPYQSSLEWLTALVHTQLEFVNNGPIADDDEYDEENFEEESPIMRNLCKGFLNVLPTICSDGEEPAFCLHHHDLNAANIIVDPDTFEIKGIVDWEFINVVPQWTAFEPPEYIRNGDPWSEEEPEIPDYEDEEDDSHDMKVDKRDRWDDRILRHHFDQVMTRLTQNDGVSSERTMEDELKRDCCSKIREITENFNWPKNWLRTYVKTGVNRNSLNTERVYGEPSSDDEDDTWLDGMQT